MTRPSRSMRSLLVALVVVVPFAAFSTASSQPAGGLPPVEPFSLTNGTIVVAEEGAGRVVAVRPNGTVDVLAAGLDPARSVAIDADGSVVASEPKAGRVIRLVPTGVAELVADGLDGPDDVVTGPGGSVYVAEFGANRVTGISSDGSVTGLAEVLEPSGIDLSAGSSELSVSSRGPDRFAGEVLTVPIGGGTATPAFGPFEIPMHIDLGPDFLFLSDAAGRIVEVSGDLREIKEGPPLVMPVGIAVDPVPYPGGSRSYSLLVTHDDQLIRMDPVTGETQVIQPLNGPAGVDVFRTGAGPPPETPSPSPTPTASPSPSRGGEGGEGGGDERQNRGPWPFLLLGACGALLGLLLLGLAMKWWALSNAIPLVMIGVVCILVVLVILGYSLGWW